MTEPVRFSIRLRSIERALVILFAVSTLLALAALLVEYVAGNPFAYGFVPQFGHEYEQNLQTWYAALLLLAAALTLFVIARRVRRAGGPFARRWFVLGAIFLYISIDEAAVIHELINDSWLDGYKVSGAFYFMWIYPAAALLVVFLAAYWRFFLALVPAVRSRVALAGLLYVGGALGTELPLGFWAAAHGDTNLVYGAIQACQETLELAGASLFLATLLRHLAAGAPRLALSVGGEDQGEDEASGPS